MRKFFSRLQWTRAISFTLKFIITPSTFLLSTLSLSAWQRSANVCNPISNIEACAQVQRVQRERKSYEWNFSFLAAARDSERVRWVGSNRELRERGVCVSHDFLLSRLVLLLIWKHCCESLSHSCNRLIPLALDIFRTHSPRLSLTDRCFLHTLSKYKKKCQSDFYTQKRYQKPAPYNVSLSHSRVETSTDEWFICIMHSATLRSEMETRVGWPRVCVCVYRSVIELWSPIAESDIFSLLLALIGARCVCRKNSTALILQAHNF
jgi:hypothetical protein